MSDMGARNAGVCFFVCIIARDDRAEFTRGTNAVSETSERRETRYRERYGC